MKIPGDGSRTGLIGFIFLKVQRDDDDIIRYDEQASVLEKPALTEDWFCLSCTVLYQLIRMSYLNVKSKNTGNADR